MSFLGKLLGIRSFSQQKQAADALFASGEFGQAKLAYERARDRAGGASEEELQGIAQRIDDCRDEMAAARMAEARELLRRNQVELAVVELEDAAEIAASASVVEQAERMLEEVERSQARELAAEPEPPSDEDRFAIIAGTWEDDQAEEYEGYGEPLRTALLALHGGQTPEARQALEQVLQSASDPRYLLFEVGRARLMDGDDNGGTDAMTRFLSRLGPEQGGDCRLVAHAELARLARQKGMQDAAIAQLQEALEAMPRDPRPYWMMGNHLHQEGHLEEAIEVLESGLAALREAGPDWRIVQELGLIHADLGNHDQALTSLEQVIEILTAHQQLDLPPETAVKLAELHEKAGNRARAADLYTMLAQGSDRSNHFRYYREAARLLQDLGLEDEARKMSQRAQELAPDNSES